MKFAQDLEKLSPLQVNEATGEPYLPLPAPHSRLRLTPPRPEDVPLLVGHMNDPEIYTYLAGPPFPYTEAHGRQWVHNGVQESQRLFEQIERGDRWIDGCPVRVIRQVGEEDGTEVYVGDIGISRLDPGKGFMTEEAENLTKEVGDPTLWWTVGDYVIPSHRRQGIMSAALRTLIDVWAVPRMNVHRIHATAFIGNEASLGVFLKAGFERKEDVLDVVRLSEGRGGQLMSVHAVEWTRRGASSIIRTN